MTDQAGGPSLSILIPAYNQGQEAAATISLLATQITSWPGAIEVILSDNFSDPNHFNRIKDLPDIYSWLKVFRQEANLGFKGNVGFLSNQAQFERCIILGCGDLADLVTLSAVLEKLSKLRLDPEIIVSNVSSHSILTDMPFTSNDQPIVNVRSWTSKWVPYQEAIPGQIYKTSILKSYWMIVGGSGDTWPHIDLAFRILSRDQAIVARTNATLVSMHQTTTSWYFKPGANVSALLKHLAILFRNAHRGIGVLAKLAVLSSQGLFMAITQDITAAKKRH
jgi:glycosyltransferase involved in cell wall biosynthesis